MRLYGKTNQLFDIYDIIFGMSFVFDVHYLLWERRFSRCTFCKLAKKKVNILHDRLRAVLPYNLYSVILSVLDPRKCEYLKDCSLDFEHAYMTTYLAS